MAWQEGKVSLSFLKYQEQRDIQGLLKRKKRLYKLLRSAHVGFETEKEKTEQGSDGNIVGCCLRTCSEYE